jgi:tetratricopeptide (TPR) repeat protein
MSILCAQEDSLIFLAKQFGNSGKYQNAIDLLNSNSDEYKNNPDFYYWLGRYSHYIVYDSRPFVNKNNDWSEKNVLMNLKKSIELNPNFGDAKYFIAVEYGARALEALKKNDTVQYKKEFIDAYNSGGFPLHEIELAKNILMSCDSASILIVDGDALFNVIQYVQLIQFFRRDISLVCLSLLERPYYVKLLRNGIDNFITSVPITLADNNINEMHNYKWQENYIDIEVSSHVKDFYNLNDTTIFCHWLLKPDICNKKLWSGTAILANILESNKWERPIHTVWFGINDISGFENNMQIVGLTARLFPKKVRGTIEEYDIVKFESLMLNPNNYLHYNDIYKNQQPRVSGIFGNLSRKRIVDYACFINKLGEHDKARKVIEQMNSLMPLKIFPIDENIQNNIESIIN